MCSLEDELKIKISELNDENEALKVEKADLKGRDFFVHFPGTQQNTDCPGFM